MDIGHVVKAGNIVSLDQEGLRQCFDDGKPPDFYLTHEDWNRWRVDGIQVCRDGGLSVRVHVVWSEAGPGGEQFDTSAEFMTVLENGDPEKCWPVLGDSYLEEDRST